MAFFKRVTQENTAISSITPGIAVFLYLSMIQSASPEAVGISKSIAGLSASYLLVTFYRF